LSQLCTVLIAAPDLLPLLKHANMDGGELLVFSDTDMALALDAITERHPEIVAIEQLFAGTPRGIAFIHRIQIDPALTGCEIRVMSHGGGFRVVSGDRLPGAGESAASKWAPIPGATLDARGTRRAQRFAIAGPLEITVDGNPATLVDLSGVGAQVLSPTVLKPNQRVRVSLSDAHGTTRFNASIAWAAFEIPPGTSPRYRAGIEFLDADVRVLNGYCLKYSAG
jgi:hypothetical protein